MAFPQLKSQVRQLGRIALSSVVDPAVSLAITYANPLFGPRASVRPPGWLNYSGGGDFEKVGRANVVRLQQYGGLKQDDRILEIGCGICRNAAYLTDEIPEGTYHGFDILRSGISWGRTRITRDHPNFQFIRVDVANSVYNPGGRIHPAAFRFPFEADSFDLSFAFSVFTHMLREETAVYFAETARVLAPGGRFVLTAFILDEQTRAGIEEGKAKIAFAERHGKSIVQFAHSPEVAVAYDAGDLVSMLDANGLAISRTLHGKWSGHPDYDDYQDLIIAERKDGHGAA